MEEYSYYEVWFINLESDKRWFIAQCPAHWEEYDLRNKIMTGDVSEIISINPTCKPEDDIYRIYNDEN